MDEDEEVIFEGSPLHSYLLEAGITDYETVPSKRTSLIHEDSSGTQNKIKASQSYLAGIFHFFMVFLGIDKVEKDVSYLVIKKLLGSKLLEEEDVLIIQNFSHKTEEILDGNDNPSFILNKDLNLFPPLFSLPLKIGWSSLIIGFVSYIFAWKDACLCSCCIIFTLAALLILRCCFVQRLVCTLKNVDLFVSLMSRVKGRTLRSLKMLKENEIIFRGNFSESSLHRPDPQSLCGSLLALYESVSSSLKASHDTICTSSSEQTLQNVASTFDYRFQEDSLVADGNISTENLTSAKMKRDVVLLQCSAFFCELILYFDFTNLFFKMYQLGFLLQSEHLEVIEKKLIELECALKIFETFWVCGSNSLKKSKSYEEVKDDLVVAANTLSFHSKNSLLKIINLSNRLDRDAATNRPPSADSYPSYEDATASCQEIECELQSCIGCLSDLRERLKRQHYKNESKTAPQLPERETEEDVCRSSTDAIPIMEADSPVVVDEVFEAYVDENASEDLALDEPSSGWVVERRKAKEIQKKQRQQCRRVLMEIQPILLERRVMWQRREEDALKRQREVVSAPPAGPRAEGERPALWGEGGTKEGREGSSFEEFAHCQDYKAENFLSIKENDECDSEEERLDLYRKVRRELDEDEAMRSAAELEEAQETCFPPPPFRKTEFEWEDINDSDSEEDPDSDSARRKLRETLTKSLFFQFETLQGSQKHGDPIPNLVNDSDVSPSCNGTVASTSSTDDSPSMEMQDGGKATSETFSSGDELSDSDDRIIDWSSCGFSRPSLQSAEERISSWVAKEGFSLRSLLSTEKDHQAAPLRNPLEEVTFDGYGEGDADEEASESDAESSQ